MANTNSKRLTADQFTALLPHLERLDEANVAALRRIMVEGRAQKDMAAVLQVTPKCVSRLVKRAWDKHVALGACPTGWEQVSVALPPVLASVVRAASSELRKAKP